MRIRLAAQLVAAVSFGCLFNPVMAGGAQTPAPSTTQPSAISPTDVSSTSDGSSAGADLAPELELYKDIPVVVAAANHAQTTNEAPASVSLVTAEQIKQFGYENLADVLRNQRSFYLDTDGLNWFVGVRGFSRSNDYNSRVAVLVDGRPENELIYGQSHFDTNMVVPMEAIQRVEVVRGPASALYGTNAVFGVVDVVTKNGSDINGVETSLLGGTRDTAQANVLAGGTVDGADVVFDWNGFTSQGDRHIHLDGISSPALNLGNIDDQDYSKNYSGYFKTRFDDFTAEVNLDARKQDNEYATYFSTFFDTGQIREQRNELTLKYDHDFSAGQSVHAMAYFIHYGYEQPIPESTSPSGRPSFVYYTTATEDYLGQDAHYDVHLGDKIFLIAGADGVESLNAKQHDYTTNTGDVLDINDSYSAYALYSQGEFHINDKLSVTAGVRVDHLQRLQQQVDPRAALIYDWTKDDTLKALYGTAFRQPTLYDLFYRDPGSNTPNPDLRPEEISTYELVEEKRLADNWSASLDGFYWRMRQATGNVTLGDGSIQTQNVGTFDAKGVEAEIDKTWATHGSFRLYATYDWTDAAGNLPPESPKWIVGSALAWPIISRNSVLAVEPQVVGPMSSASGGDTKTTFITNVVFTTDDLLKNCSIEAGVFNLFANGARFPAGGPDEQLEKTLNYPGAEFRLGITYHF